MKINCRLFIKLDVIFRANNHGFGLTQYIWPPSQVYSYEKRKPEPSNLLEVRISRLPCHLIKSTRPGGHILVQGETDYSYKILTTGRSATVTWQHDDFPELFPSQSWCNFLVLVFCSYWKFPHHETSFSEWMRWPIDWSTVLGQMEDICFWRVLKEAPA